VCSHQACVDKARHVYSRGTAAAAGGAKWRAQTRAEDGGPANGDEALQAMRLDDTIFEALARARQIHKDCQLLVATNHQMIGCAAGVGWR
jgi:hypothetical protein